ncbi:MAG: methyltransferase domain-containing protein, partial [Chlamydiia bacterium]|nr:methyltransferase domain-containing protein [Chlamydiia bacterium]
FDNNQETLNLLLERPGQVILDAGCGAGFSGLILFGPHAHRHRYIGVDIAADAIKTAKQRFKEA